MSCVACAADVERRDAALDALLAPDAQVETLAKGFHWSEGPVWFRGALVFSDVPTNIAYRWAEGMKQAEVFLQPSGLLHPAPGFREQGSNGLAVDAEGRLLLCQHGERRVARWVDGKFTPIADRYEGKRFNSPNDLALRRNGDIYFTDPPYGLEGLDKSPLKELTWNGVYRVTTKGEVTLLTKTLTYPNGIAFSPDERTLYVGVSDPKSTRVVAFTVGDDGSLSAERTFFDGQSHLSADSHGSCDGLKSDRDGNVWTTGPGGVWIISPAGKILGRVRVPGLTANCNWGGDGSVLYLTSADSLRRIPTRTRGAGW